MSAASTGRFDGKVAIVTGASRGIGFAVAERFVADGGRVCITARKADALAEAVERLGGTERAIFVAGAAGMRIFWSWVAPGARTRGAALAEDGRALFTVVIGLILALFVSGIIEGFVTRQDWPWPIKIGIGTIALGSFLFYQWVIGRRASRGGQTGDLEEFEGGAKQLVAG